MLSVIVIKIYFYFLCQLILTSQVFLNFKLVNNRWNGTSNFSGRPSTTSMSIRR